MKSIFYVARLFILFLFAFAVSRLIFICYFFPLFSHEPIVHILLSFYYALKIDIATSCYLLLFPILVITVGAVVGQGLLIYVRRVYVALILFINAMTTSADLGLYQEWGTKMNYRAMIFLQHPSEVISTATLSQIMTFILLTILQMGLSYYIYRRWVESASERIKNNRVMNLICSICLIPVCVIGIRGGWQEIPIQMSDSYYSSNPNLNWAAVNSLWNFGQSVTTGMQYGLKNPYQFFKKEDAQRVVSNLYTVKSDTTEIFLKNQQPNIVFIIFEGWSADLIESISQNHEHSSTPNFDKLASQGLLFTQCLASGERSDQGLAAILSSFPSLPLSSIVNYPEKVGELPSLLKPFKEKGYRSLFLFGGQLSYGNLKALIYHNGFDKVIEEKDIDPKIHRGRLGVHDQHTFDLLYRELNLIKGPFIAGFFTQSTHFSYDYPKAKTPVTWAGGESDYANSLGYADSCLGDFFAKAKKQAWFANTLFIMVADHSHVMPWNDDHKKAALHHIPLLFYGDVIKDEYRGIKKNETVSQQDICATLLSQLALNHSNFKWSKDLMNPDVKSFAYWTFTDGFGFTRSSDCEFVYDLANKKTISSYADCDSMDISHQGFSYLQMIFEDFITTGGRTAVQTQK